MIVPGPGRGAVADAGVWSATVVEHLDVLGDSEPCPSAGGEHLLDKDDEVPAMIRLIRCPKLPGQHTLLGTTGDRSVLARRVREPT